MIYTNYLKRILDILISLLTLITLIPLFFIIAISIKLSSKGSILFKQNRVGKNGKTFKIYKFRTMHENPDRKLTQTTNVDPEVFTVGKLLRRLKIDELPQIYNVLKGDMSIVGPRPCMPQTLGEMPPWAQERFRVKPGLTGKAQVNGNISISWQERWKYDVDYVKNQSFLSDISIISKTILVVLFGENKFRKTI